MKSFLISTLMLCITVVSSQGEGYPGNPCEKVSASCDPIIPGFCSDRYDVPVNLPCGPRGYVGVGCCWHAPPPS
ncbi:uncharacterized protein BX664DRAFT_320606 [Halteromyces radiatus]|uniref:uncharacterized protein n=1 Tax=Halteromyces radiatus TaxID=101107 RepID=UPI002220D1D1|nr:uncharacterized protein BX664DRAFT_320606 [Halteromyces radiatus]KAI8099185.1 hypothetical protein BX664DRAFT_320606 [Halteromyces radiatus]